MAHCFLNSIAGGLTEYGLSVDWPDFLLASLKLKLHLETA